jgi:hypothetical protein
VNVALGRWAAANVPETDWIAADDAGAIRYFSRRRVLDLVGLNSAPVLRQGRVGALVRLQPRWLIVHGALFAGLARDPRFQRVHAIRPERYTICACPNDEVIVYRAGDRAYAGRRHSPRSTKSSPDRKVASWCAGWLYGPSAATSGKRRATSSSLAACVAPGPLV